MKKTNSLFATSNQASRLLKPLADLFARLSGQTVALGFSAGADSAMLAVCAAEVAEQYGIDLRLLHIHHGLMKHADDWVHQAEQLAAYFDVDLTVIHVEVNRQSGLGIEAAAREARYRAFADYAHQHHIKHFLLAHHLDDQAETLLLRLLRGSGVRGMRGMQTAIERDGLIFHRPWLGCERKLILTLAAEFAAQTGWQAVQDESNYDTLYKRAAVRVELAPVLNRYWSSWRQNLARHARLMDEAQAIMEDMAVLDFQNLAASEDKRSFCLKAWRALPAYRQSNVLRYWLALLDLQMPTDRRLQDWLKQLREVHQLGFDREVRLPHEGHTVVVSKGRVEII
ncbi:MAG: tRNA lysidine(34) synthetase TilS [Pelistega sp.]|nr:tRNA lysidine(34) synthetase TilS [Pelistega sp.]